HGFSLGGQLYGCDGATETGTNHDCVEGHGNTSWSQCSIVLAEPSPYQTKTASSARPGGRHSIPLWPCYQMTDCVGDELLSKSRKNGHFTNHDFWMAYIRQRPLPLTR